MTDVLKLLPPFEWRGAQYPVTARRVSFRHEGVEHVIQYRDDEFIEQLGAHGLTFAYTIPCREDIARGPYKNLFVQGLPRLFRDMRSRTPDNLNDPVFGFFRCKPTSFDDTTDPQRRDGDDVQVEFKYSPDLSEEDPEIQTNLEGSITNLETDAGALDQAAAEADWAQEPSPEPTIDPIQGANGVLAQGLAQVEKVSASLDDFAAKLEALEQTCDRAENPQNWPIRASARRLREAAVRTKQRLSEDPVVKIKRVTTKSIRLISELAKEVGMTLDEFIRLNPALVRLPFVPQGTVVLTRARS
jgi:hypothetical protein